MVIILVPSHSFLCANGKKILMIKCGIKNIYKHRYVSYLSYFVSGTVVNPEHQRKCHVYTLRMLDDFYVDPAG